jgi:anaphase-promoting complex subunit 8
MVSSRAPTRKSPCMLSTHRSAELLTSLPEAALDESNASIADGAGNFTHPAFTANVDPTEAALEARELDRYLLAKSLFDCKEFDRCTAVFLPDSLLSGIVSSAKVDETTGSPAKGKGRGRAAHANVVLHADRELPEISQRSLFLALYAKVISGEKRKDEDSEMVMGPQDLGATVNKQLLSVSRFLERWFGERTSEEDDEIAGSQGFLEYL